MQWREGSYGEGLAFSMVSRSKFQLHFCGFFGYFLYINEFGISVTNLSNSMKKINVPHRAVVFPRYSALIVFGLRPNAHLPVDK